MWTRILGNNDELVQDLTVAAVKPPHVVFYDGRHFVHCGTLCPENVSIYRQKSFGFGKNIEQAENRNHTCYSGGNLFSGERK